MSDVPEQRGKDVTIYAGYNPNMSLSDWRKTLQKIEQQLTAEKIPPGDRSPGFGKKPEKPMSGSHYFTYRYEHELYPERGWPEEDFCAREGFGITVANQLPIPEWGNNIYLKKLEGSSSSSSLPSKRD